MLLRAMPLQGVCGWQCAKPLTHLLTESIELLNREVLGMNSTKQDNSRGAVGQCEPKGEPLWELYDQLDQLRVETSKSVNPLVKAKNAEKAIPVTQELIRQMIVRIKQLETLAGVK